MDKNKNTTQEAKEKVGDIVENAVNIDQPNYREHDQEKLAKNDTQRLVAAYYVATKVNEHNINNDADIVLSGVSNKMQTASGKAHLDYLKEAMSETYSNITPTELFEKRYKDLNHNEHKMGVLGVKAREQHHKQLDENAKEFAKEIVDFVEGKSEKVPDLMAGKEVEMEFAVNASRSEIKAISINKEVMEALSTLKDQGEKFIKETAKDFNKFKEKLKSIMSIPEVKENKNLQKDLMALNTIVEDTVNDISKSREQNHELESVKQNEKSHGIGM